ncbi:MAG: Dps family protein [Planctomycetota bacterium]
MATPTQTHAETTVESSVIEALSALLANSYTLYVKTHNYHWNVTGPMFSSLHALFEMQYTELATAVDEIAERIRALGAFAPGSFTAFEAMSAVSEDTGHPTAEQMIGHLADDNETLAAAAQRTFEAAEQAGDSATADLATERIQVHQKNAWMLRSHLR